MNKAKLKLSTTNHEYNVIFIMINNDPWYEGYNDNHHGQSHNKLRSYKSWKHNRKTQYKK